MDGRLSGATASVWIGPPSGPEICCFAIGMPSCRFSHASHARTRVSSRSAPVASVKRASFNFCARFSSRARFASPASLLLPRPPPAPIVLPVSKPLRAPPPVLAPRAGPPHPGPLPRRVPGVSVIGLYRAPRHRRHAAEEGLQPRRPARWGRGFQPAEDHRQRPRDRARRATSATRTRQAPSDSGRLRLQPRRAEAAILAAARMSKRLRRA